MANIYMQILRKPSSHQYLGNAVLYIEGQELIEFKTVETIVGSIEPGKYGLNIGIDPLNEQFYGEHFEVNDLLNKMPVVNAVSSEDGNIKIGRAFMDFEGDGEWTTSAGFSVIDSIFNLIGTEDAIVLEISTLPTTP